ncbi:unnamed protein product [Wickerhamomyces anomalus]
MSSSNSYTEKKLSNTNPLHSVEDFDSHGNDEEFFKLAHSGGDNIFKTLKDNPLVFFIVLFASIGGILFGYDQGVVSGILTQQSFGARFPRIYKDADYKGWFVSTLLICAWFGSLIFSPIVDKYGRRNSIVIASVIFIIGSIFQCAGHSISMLFGGRAVTGLGVGALTMVVPMFISELAPPSSRGQLVSLQQLSITIGILISYWIDYGTNYIGGTHCSPGTPYADGDSFNPYTDVPLTGCDGQKDASWRVPFGLQIFPAAVLGIGMCFLPKSPRWLLMKGFEDESLKTLAYVRRLPTGDLKIQAEFLEMKGEVLFEKQFKEQKFGGRNRLMSELLEFKSLFFIKANFRRVFIGSAIMFFQQFLGCNAIIYYSPEIFKKLGLTGNISGLLASGVYSIVNCLSTIPAIIFLDKLGRKPMLMAGSVGTCISLAIVGGIVGKYDGVLDQHKSAGWCAVAFIYIFDVNFSYSWAPIGWVYPSEIFPLGIRSKAISITTSSTWMCNFIIGLVTPMMLEKMKFGTYVFFAAFAFISFFFVWFFIPETKLKTLEEMDEVFGDEEVYQNKHDMQAINANLIQELKRNDLETKQHIEHVE